MTASCDGARGEGSFAVHFAWDENLPPASSPPLYLFASLEQWPGGDVAQRYTLGQAGPVQSGTEATLTFANLAYGDDRVVVARVREAPDVAAPVLYFGISERFTIVPGERRDVRVLLQLTPVPGLTAAGATNAVAIYANGVAAASVPSAVVDLHLRVTSATHATVANDAAFSVGVRSFVLAELTALPDGAVVIPDWDLNAGMSPWSRAIDGTRNVFVKVANDFGFESEPAFASARLDRERPSAVGCALSYRPGATNPLFAVQGATVGTVASVTLNTSEPLLAAPALAAVHGSSSLTFAPDVARSTSTFFAYELAVTQELEAVDGSYELRATLIDEAGNAAASDLCGLVLVVDRQAPDIFRLVNLDRLKHLRIPWGNDQTAGVPAHFMMPADLPATADLVDLSQNPIAADAFRQPGEVLVAVRAYDSRWQGRLLGTSAPTATGWSAVKLAGGDSEQLWVSAIDRAGNESEQARVAHSEWVATTGGKIPGRIAANPTVVELTPDLSRALHPTARQEPMLDELRKVDRTDGRGLESGTTAVWRDLTAPARQPMGLVGHRAVYDPTHGSIVLFGGAQNGNDVWEMRLSVGNWSRRTGVGAVPAGRTHHGMALDAGRGTVVVFGGVQNDSDTIWEWESATGGWTRSQCLGGCPAWSGDDPWETEIAYDSLRRRVVAYGGALEGTWEWDAASSMWTQAATAPQSPPARTDHTMVFDPLRGVTVLFGGTVGGTALASNDLWEWDGARWLARHPDGPLPSSRRAAAMVFDRRRGEVLVAGGAASGDLAVLDDLWAWDGARDEWREVVPEGDRPPARMHHALVYDDGADALVTIGGCGEVAEPCGVILTDVWALVGDTWRELSRSSVVPPARRHFDGAFDAKRRRIVVFGGYDAAGAPLGDTWEWDTDTGNWQERTPMTLNPAPRAGHALYFDPALGKVVLFGGDDGTRALGDLWTWDGSAGVWQEAWSPPHPPGPGDPFPAPRFDHAMRSLPRPAASEVGLLVGGCASRTGSECDTLLGDAWLWDGVAGSWTELTAGGPPPRSQHGLAVDPVRGKVVVSGGQIESGGGIVADATTWEWDVALDAWSSSTRCYYLGACNWLSTSMAFDPWQRRVALFGGETASLRNWTLYWEPTFKDWLVVRVTGAMPSERKEHVVLFDDTGDAMWVFGGTTTTGPINDLWQLRSGTAGRPGALWTIPAGSVLQGTGDLEFVGLSVAAKAGATGYDDLGARVDGVAMLIWDTSAGGEWKPIAQDAAGAESPATLTASVLDARELRHLLLGDEKQISLALAAVASQSRGPAGARLLVDYLEVRVTYRIRSVQSECYGECQLAPLAAAYCVQDSTLCHCDAESGQWTQTSCAEFCHVPAAEAPRCVQRSVSRGPVEYCDCSLDCTNDAAVQASCYSWQHNPCTCAASDPCQWVNDQSCDLTCEVILPGGAFDDSIDCDVDCSDTAALASTCEAQSYTRCTCAAADPCGWTGDGYCDHSYCAWLSPSDHLEDAADCQPDCSDLANVLGACGQGRANRCTCAASDPCRWADDGYCDLACVLGFSDDQFDDTRDCGL
jgi:hypothetical protein